jgi:hypothetical protein
MAGKRRKKHAATEVTAAPDVATGAGSAETQVETPAKLGKAAATRGDVSVTSKTEQAREKATTARADGKVPITRADVAPSPVASSAAAAAPDNAGSADDREQQIRERAYHLWKHAGEPHGQHEDYWVLAEKELLKG